MSGVSTAGSMAKDHGLSFSPEIINGIIANLDLNEMTYTELAITWGATRRVSKQFCSEITRIFGRKVLPEMTVSYNLETDIPLKFQPWHRLGLSCVSYLESCLGRAKCKGLKTGSLNMSLKFDHFSEDGVVAYFKAYKWRSEASSLTGAQNDDHQISFFRALELFRTIEPDFAKGSRQLIHLRGVFQDMALPCFTADEGKQEIGFDWKDLFSALFREEMQVDSAIDIFDPMFSNKIERQRDQRRYLLRWRRFEDQKNNLTSCSNIYACDNSRDSMETTRTVYRRNFAAKASWVGQNLGLCVDHGYYKRIQLIRDHMDPEDRD